MHKKYNFVYITTNLINGKQYVGDHSTNNLNDNYLGSGRPYFKNALNEYGKQNFKRQILQFFDTKEEAFDTQEKYIIKYNTLSPNGYNISPTGGHGVNGCISEETKEKIRKKAKGRKLSEDVKIRRAKHTVSEETKEKIRKKLKGRKLSKETLNKRGHLSEIHKINISKGSIGKTKPPRTEVHIENLKKSLKGKNKGKKQKMFKCPHCNKEGGNTMFRWHFDKCKLKK